MGFFYTDLTWGMDTPKSSAEDIVSHALDGLEDGQHEVLADVTTQQIEEGTTAPTPSYLQQPT
jgi:hypothetical protein